MHFIEVLSPQVLEAAPYRNVQSQMGGAIPLCPYAQFLEEETYLIQRVIAMFTTW